MAECVATLENHCTVKIVEEALKDWYKALDYSGIPCECVDMYITNISTSVASLLRTPLGPHYLSLIHVQCSLFIKDTIGPTLPVLNTCTV